eukprot:TRINITY_DN64291_c0_g1_i1.p2 TRINITY_DN64291_c0_g1~~TRINITY_DN64291_c0_g1_i1.p2  ORF type:complete len:789 (+),score=98.96 TRINITY_DN64291_c0_g1_i1:87-2369(+)
MDFDDHQPDALDGDAGDSQDQNLYNEPFILGEDPDEPTQQNDAVIFVLDCGKFMRESKPGVEGGKSNVTEVLSAACSFMKTKIISSEKDRVAIVLYSCSKVQNPLDLPGIHVIHKLETPDAASIKDLDRFSKDEELFESTFCPGVAPETLLCDVFSVCHNLFQVVEKLNYAKRIFLFTNNDNPNSASKHEQSRAIQRARDLYEQDVDIELFPMQGIGEFDVAKFFADLIAVDPEQLGALTSKEATEERFQELTKRIRQKEYKKRTLGRTLFHLSPKMNIAVKVYNLAQEVKKPSAKNLDAKTNKPLRTLTRWVCEETGAVLYPDQIGTYYPYGGEKVTITKEESKTIKKFDSPGIKLMGFKPRTTLKDYMNIRSSYFISADDSAITNSSQVMDALIKQMLAKDKIAIVRVIPREASIVRFCALLPQIESIDPEDNFRHPQGFNMVFLPYADDIRSPESIIKAGEQHTKVSEEQLKAAKLLIKNLSIDFDSRQFENPAIQKFYAAIQALALNEEQPEEVKDIMQPDYEGMSKFAAIIEQFKETTFGEGYEFCNDETRKGKGKRPMKDHAGAPGKGKRKKNGSDVDQSESQDEEKKVPKKKEVKKQSKKRGKQQKKEDEESKTEEMDMSMGDIMEDRKNEEDGELKDKFEDGTISSYTIAQLKDILRERRLKIGKASKDALLGQLRNYLKLQFYARIYSLINQLVIIIIEYTLNYYSIRKNKMGNELLVQKTGGKLRDPMTFFMKYYHKISFVKLLRNLLVL